MSGYVWAKTPEGELFVVLMVAGKGYVPGVEGAIGMDEFFVLEPVAWPTAPTPQSQNLPPTPRGALVPAATRGSCIRLCVANG